MSGRPEKLLLLLISAITVGHSNSAAQENIQQGVTSQHPQTESAYVRRMMSLDADGSGTLTAEELPGKMSALVEQHDRNGDDQLDVEELSAIESSAHESRTRPPAQGSSGRQGRRRTGGGATGGSPLDPSQILKYALTFDADGDGGLNSAELRRYAAALAIRRGQGRGPLMENGPPAQGAEPTVQPRGSGRPKASEKAGGAKPKGLSSDGTGDGGFGDDPPVKKSTADSQGR